MFGLFLLPTSKNKTILITSHVMTQVKIVGMLRPSASNRLAWTLKKNMSGKYSTSPLTSTGKFVASQLNSKGQA